MALVDTQHCNTKTVKLTSPNATVTLDCSNLFTMSRYERDFVLDLLRMLEDYENAPAEGGGDAEA